MPYSNEKANPTGYDVLFSDPTIVERIKTMSFERKYENADRPELQLKTLDAGELSPSFFSIEDLETAVAIDGSKVIPNDDDEDISMSITVLKLGLAIQDFKAISLARSLDAPPGPALWDSVYQNQSFTSVLSGKGVFSRDGGDWKRKAKEELWRTLKEWTVPDSTMSLIDVLRKVTSKDQVFYCPECPAKSSTIDFDFFMNGVGECLKCGYDPIYYSDYLIDIFADKHFFQNMMLFSERLLMAGMAITSNHSGSAYPAASSLFVTDGPLALYTGLQHFNKNFLSLIQGLDTFPAMVGFEKTGELNRFAARPRVQALIPPGSVAMITGPALKLLSGLKPDEPIDDRYSYGKRFLYRTRSGEKTFVFMTPPAVGLPYPNGKTIELSEEWGNYPALKLICDYIEGSTTDVFGKSTAALDIIAEANYTASLPQVLSMKSLNDLIRDNMDRLG